MDLCENGELRNRNIQASNLNFYWDTGYKEALYHQLSLQRLLAAVLSMVIMQRPLDACFVKTLMKVTIASTTHGATATAGTTIEKTIANILVRC